MDWIQLQTPEQLDKIKNNGGYAIIFKHSTRCSISTMAKRNFELYWDVIPAGTPMYFLDLIHYRSLSNQVAELFQVTHQSPQILLIRDGECIYETSHGEISADEVTLQFV